MNLTDFWVTCYLACIHNGDSNEEAKKVATQAVQDLVETHKLLQTIEGTMQ